MTDLFIEDIPYEEIIGHLNKITGKTFRLVESHREFIRARWGEGFRLGDFIHVIRVKYQQWHGTDDDIYIRPSTLFGTKMDGYRQQRYRKPPSEREPEPNERELTAQEKQDGEYSCRYIGILRKRRSFDWDAAEFERLKKEWIAEPLPRREDNQ